MARDRYGFWPARTTDGSQPEIDQYPLVSGTYYEGMVVRVSGTSGSARIAAAASTSAIGVIGCYVTTAKSTAAGTTYPIYMGNPNTIFEAKMIKTGGVKPQTRVGDLCDLSTSSSGHRLQATSSTNLFSIVGVHPDEPANITNSPIRYWVKFARSVFAQTKSDSSK